MRRPTKANQAAELNYIDAVGTIRCRFWTKQWFIGTTRENGNIIVYHDREDSPPEQAKKECIEIAKGMTLEFRAWGQRQERREP